MMENVNAQRSFIIGDSWLYYKVYTGHKTADLVLTEIVLPVTELLFREGIIDKWFFIRYSDPKFHLRLRFHFDKPEALGQIINLFREKLLPYVQQELVWNIQIDTYKRELERYGRVCIEESETLFFYDSQLTVGLLTLIEGSEGEEIRWLFALKSIDSMLDIFQYTNKAKLVLLEQLKTSFGKEFGMARPLKRQLDEKYRKNRKKIDDFLDLDFGKEQEYEPILNLLKERETRSKPVAKSILDHHDSGRLEMATNDLIGSHIHMMMNRLFRSKNRLHELVVYDFLYRVYKSQLAKEKNQIANSIVAS